MSVENPLGHHTVYPSVYDATLLFPIKRTESRDKLGLSGELPFQGNDRWTAYEVSWLDESGKPQVRVAEFIVACDSPNIIESKSFKLYLNSFNQTVFAQENDVVSVMSNDLSVAAGAAVLVNLLPLDDALPLAVSQPIGQCIDDLPVNALNYEPKPELLSVSTTEKVSELVYSHLLKTNCPVTDQPDWATVFIEYSGFKIDHSGLLAYIISFREHQDFHENSVERLFCDLKRFCKPDQLTVYARYTRRGGLDINPLRTSYKMEAANGEPASQLISQVLRTIRQ
ncbi:NADPH-dependent 7-cyano-7-deazaguanine reductase QueF [Eionea flava]